MYTGLRVSGLNNIIGLKSVLNYRVECPES